jgi:hypothetical protein
MDAINDAAIWPAGLAFMAEGSPEELGPLTGMPLTIARCSRLEDSNDRAFKGRGRALHALAVAVG